MFTIAIPAYNNPDFTRMAVDCAMRATAQINLPTRFILIDDAAGTGESVTDAFRDLRTQNSDRDILIARSTSRLHYPGSFSLALHLSETPLTLFLSNDMVLTPSYLLATLGVASISPSFGCVRGSSGYTDSLPEHVLPSPTMVDSYVAAAEFAQFVFRTNGLAHVDNKLLCGDAVIIRRELIDSIGVHDPSLTPYFSDIDYGMRAQLAGFRLVGELGAWLFHEGAGYIKREATRRGEANEVVLEERRQRIEASWQAFRRKWGEDLPPSPFQFDYSKFGELARDRALQVSLKVETPADLLGRVEFV